MLSKIKIKWIKSLGLKKNRDEEGVFVAEGFKITSDLFPFLKCRFLAVTDDDIGAGFPLMAIASSRHESQYSRLFRS